MQKYIKICSSMLRSSVLLVLMFLCSITYSSAQVSGNEWIDFNQVYYKIPTAANGIYRLTYDDLLSYGFPVNSVDPRRIQLFHRGQEQAIIVAGQEDARINPGDYIDFYGVRNDGTSEAELYVPASAQPHNYYSLYTDTTSYFLTWRLSNTAGKRVTTFTEANISNLAAQPYHVEERLMVQTQEYAVGRVYPEGSNEETILTQFDYGEGWTGTRIRKAQFADFTLNNITRTYRSGPKPVLEILLTGRNNRPHNVTIQAGASVSALRKISDETFNYYNTHKITKEIEWSDISASGDLQIRVLVNGFPEIDADFVSVSYINLKFPQNMDFTGHTSKKLNLPVNSSGKTFIEIQNAPASTQIFDITDTHNIRIIGSNTNSGNLRAIVSGTEVSRSLFAVNGERITPKLKRVKFRNINPANHNYLIVTHKKLMAAAGDDPNPVKSYASYRASAAGGSFDTLTVDMQQVYDQFGYGEPLPLAIRRFSYYMIKGGAPEFLFLIGKALHVGHNYYRQNLSTYEHHDLVPTMGFPGSDTPFTAGLAGTSYYPAIPTGRLTARNSDEVKAYLNKVIEMERLPFNDLFRKNIVHLSGGYTAGELVLFKQIVNDFKVKAEGDYLGGKVKTLSKNTNNSVELININEEVNNGLSLVTFFGHSSPTIIDIEIGFASNDVMGYRNKGKYPMLLVNGCNAGNIFSTTYTFGEDWIVTPDRGALGVIAHSAYGYVGPLKRFSDLFYSTAFMDSTYIHKSIGAIHQETTKKYIEQATITPLNISQTQQMVLQGDPAVALFGADKPDYAVQDNLLYLQPFEGIPITALADSFSVAVIVKNFGRTQKDSITIDVRRTYSDGRVEDYEPVLFKSIKYQDTLYYTIRSKDVNSFGNNRFEVRIDGSNDVPELNENNNSAAFSFFISLSGITNLLPVNYSIVNTLNPVLQAQSTDILSKPRDYIFEIDTAYNFNSSYKKHTVVNAESLASWQINLLSGANTDSVVYYWRTKFAEPKPGEDDSWTQSSFVYINNGPEGWAQTKFPQFYEDVKRGLKQDEQLNKWVFEEPESYIKVRTFGEKHPTNNFRNVELLLNGVPYIFSERLCGDNTMSGLAFDKSSLSAYLVLDKRTCGRWPTVINNFTKIEIEGETRLMNTFFDAVDDGDYILLFSIGRVTYETWPADVRLKMKSIGASDAVLNALKNGDPYIILGRKGAEPGTAIEIVGDPSIGLANVQEIILEEIIKGKYTQGNVASTRIGPAVEWGSFQRNIKNVEVDDIVYFDVFGIDFNGNESIIMNGVMEDNIALSAIDPAQFPYLRLKATVSDDVNLTPVQLEKWHVLYKGVPEGIITLLGDKDQPLQDIKLQAGEALDIKFNFRNISTKDFTDSITVRYTVFNRTKRSNVVKDLKIPALKAGEGYDFTIAPNTENSFGINDLNVFVNPQVQPEQYYNNNIIDLPKFFEILQDNTNPVLDVAFDGIYIMDGDIVSPNPLISIKVKDENKYIFKKDTTGVEIYLKRPCETCIFEKVNFSDVQLNWQPASENKDFQVDFQPKELEDGMYTLKVQAVDGSGNKTGMNPYSVNFEVINKSEITNFYPYPNPFSTSTRFVFTLTGSEIPQEIKIQIMTVTGKIVREITQDELGPVRIGNNLSQFAWNGRDEYGDQLANGVYLYKVIIKNNGLNMDHRNTAADKAFKKGFGKLYLLR